MLVLFSTVLYLYFVCFAYVRDKAPDFKITRYFGNREKLLNVK
jgi:hypothetical protein